MWKWLKKTKEKPPEKVLHKKKTYNQYKSLEKSNSAFQLAVDELLSQQENSGLAPFHSVPADKRPVGFAMDNQLSTKFQSQGGSAMPALQAYWYASQTFIGYQLMATLSQQWLVKKCCLMPAKDAVRNGFELTVNDGTEIGPEIRDEITRLDQEYRLNYNLIQFIDQGRVFGIRIAMFIVDSPDENYYFKPFNVDGVRPGSYKGISQVDPYWITPQLDSEAAGAPASIHFYEPTWWTIAGRLVHRSHLVIFRTEEVPDILKPMYIYGGVSIPQKIYDRVYAAEKCANEAPLLLLTKRTDVVKTDLAQAEAGEPTFFSKFSEWVSFRDNYGVKVIGTDDEYYQVDTSLTDLDAVIMTQYQLVAAAAEIPAVKLLGTTPKGFNSTGEYEEANYHEMLESIQAHDLTPMIKRHHELLIRSEICPKFGIKPFLTGVSWKQLDAMTAKELAELNKLKADTDSVLSQAGAVDGYDIRERIIADPESGYNGLEVNDVPEEEDNDEGSTKDDDIKEEY